MVEREAEPSRSVASPECLHVGTPVDAKQVRHVRDGELTVELLVLAAEARVVGTDVERE